MWKSEKWKVPLSIEKWLYYVQIDIYSSVSNKFPELGNEQTKLNKFFVDVERVTGIN